MQSSTLFQFFQFLNFTSVGDISISSHLFLIFHEFFISPTLQWCYISDLVVSTHNILHHLVCMNKTCLHEELVSNEKHSSLLYKINNLFSVQHHCLLKSWKTPALFERIFITFLFSTLFLLFHSSCNESFHLLLTLSPAIHQFIHSPWILTGCSLTQSQGD